MDILYRPPFLSSYTSTWRSFYTHSRPSSCIMNRCDRRRIRSLRFVNCKVILMKYSPVWRRACWGRFAYCKYLTVNRSGSEERSSCLLFRRKGKLFLCESLAHACCFGEQNNKHRLQSQINAYIWTLILILIVLKKKIMNCICIFTITWCWSVFVARCFGEQNKKHRLWSQINLNLNLHSYSNVLKTWIFFVCWQ